MDFRRPLSAAEAEQWELLLDKLRGVQLNAHKENVIWGLEKSGMFSTKSMYRHLVHRGVINKQMREMWRSKLLMKIKTFVRLVCQDRIQSGVALKTIKWKGDARCGVCGKPEDADHIFFSCISIYNYTGAPH
jgi:hypothetical protein